MANNAFLYQGTSKKFDKYDSRFIGTGDNTAYTVKGHHFSQSKAVAEYYASRVECDAGAYVNTVTANEASTLDADSTSDWYGMKDIVELWYGDDTVANLISDIDEKTGYTIEDKIIEEIACALLTGNEMSTHTQTLLDDANYGGWDGFEAELRNTSTPQPLFDMDRDGQYQDVGIGLYEIAVMRFNEDYEKTHQFLSRVMNVDAIRYLNFGNNSEKVMNVAIWNDDVIHIKDTDVIIEPKIEPKPESTFRPRMR